MTDLSHRQRVQLALDHQSPDLVPLDFATGGNTSPVPEIYEKLLDNYPQIERQYQLMPHILRLAVVDEHILLDLDIDTRPIPMRPLSNGHRGCDKANHLVDDWGVIWKDVDVGGAIYREVVESPLVDATIDDLESYPWWPDPLDLERYKGVREHAEYLYDQTDYALVGCPAFNGVWERAYYLCGYESMLTSLVLDPEFIHAVLRRVTDITKLSLGRYLELVGPYIQVIKMGDDLGTQNGPSMSPHTYQSLIKPYHKEIFEFIKTRTDARIFLHTCGSVYKLLPDLIDAGVDILNPVQVSAQDMDTRRLKTEFGDLLSFWGAIDTQHVLPHGTVDDVKREVERRIADLAPCGGYILSSVHNVQADVPVENVIAMFRHAREVGRYPLSIAQAGTMEI
jgi:uroporphyrinogen decarboxylase